MTLPPMMLQASAGPTERVRRRLATAADFAAVHALYMHPDVVPYLGYDPMPASTFRPVYDELLASGGFYVYPARQSLGGFYRELRLTGRCRHVVQLCTLAVHPAMHGRGVAQAMVTEALALLRADGGIRRVELTVEVDNPRAIAFYQRLGFVIEGTLAGYYRRAGADRDIDEHVMGLRF